MGVTDSFINQMNTSNNSQGGTGGFWNSAFWQGFTTNADDIITAIGGLFRKQETPDQGSTFLGIPTSGQAAKGTSTIIILVIVVIAGFLLIRFLKK